MTGATGYVGGYILSELLRMGHEVVCLVRRGSESKLNRLGIDMSRVSYSYGDVATPDGVNAGDIRGCDAFIHLVGIIREFPAHGITFEKIHVEGTRNVLNAVRHSGVSRFLHMSALGTSPAGATGYERSKAAAEGLVQNSGLSWTIFRPSLIIGSRGEFTQMLKSMISMRIVPLIGAGESLFQPVAVGDVAAGYLKSLTHPDAVGKIFEIGGADVLSYREMLKIFAQEMHTSIITVPMPVFFLRTMAALLDRFAFFPLSRDQITMFLEGSVVSDPCEFRETLVQTPTPFREAVRAALEIESA